MKRFVIEHLPRAVATYGVEPVSHDEAQIWLEKRDAISLVRTTELIEAIASGFGVQLEQSDTSMTLKPGDEALLVSASFSVLLAWSQGGIVPLPEDWRCHVLRGDEPRAQTSPLAALTSEDLTSTS